MAATGQSTIAATNSVLYVANHYVKECLQYARTSCLICSDWRYKRVCLVHKRHLFLHSR